MGSLRQGLVLGIILMANLSMTARVSASVETQALPPEFNAEQPFQPEPTGIPQRRLSGGTR